MADSVLQCVKEAAKCLWPTVKLHIDYWWRFDGNVQGLRDEIVRLERERRNMDRKIEEARLRASSATTEVKDWSNEGTQKLEEATRILQGCDDLKLWNIITRYSVGKSAKDTAEIIAKLRNEVKSIRIADPAPPASMVPISHAPTFEFQSRRGIEEDIMKSLTDGNVRMIAICGTGGVGKTTMAKRIEDRVKKEKLFDEVVFVVVSQQLDVLKIQKQIAEIIRYDLSEDTLAGRAHALRTRLEDPKKKLLIFDDVWACFDPSDVGVPYENGLGGCKIILTSRDQDVCQDMEADKVIEIKVLDEVEAWTLFREKSGDCVDDISLRSIAEDVAAECKGLPIALVTVARALKKKHIMTWTDALSQLRGANPPNFPEVLEDVYMPLKLSYDFLKTRSEKDLFLLCCLFPEDYNIPIDDLALLSFGLGLFEGINSIENVRNRTHHLIERLRSRFLLMTGTDEYEVKMHDVVRDVAIFIGSKEEHVVLRSLGVDMSSKDSSRNCNWMSLNGSISNAKLLVGLDFPNLRLLMILNSDVNDICFKGMEELTVLYLSFNILLPPTMGFLKELRMLHLGYCHNVSDISVVGKLPSLEILRVWWCDYIEELPADVRKLKFLRLLELMYCRRLNRIVAGVVSSLVGLEELKIVGCFNKWEAKGNLSEERNASLSELESLRNLTSLEIDISDANLVAEEIFLSKQLVRYQIRFMIHDNFLFGFHEREHEIKLERTIELCLRRDVTVGNWIRQLVKSTQSLRLVGDGSTVKKLVNVFDCRFLQLEHLELRALRELEEIIDGTIPEGSNFLSTLKVLILRNLPNLAAFTRGVEIIKCPQLTQLEIKGCPKLRTKIGMEVSNFNGPQDHLVSCHISRCDTVEEIFWNETQEDGGNGHIIFPELNDLELRNLLWLTTFCRGVESMEFPKLQHLLIGNLSMMNSLLPIDSKPTHDHDSLHYFCNQKVEMIGLKALALWEVPDKISKIWCRHIPISFFHNLQNLYIYKVDGIRNLVSSSIAKALVNLNRLNIRYCKEMIDLINEDETHLPVNSIFPNLEYLDISYNCKLRSFCQWSHAFELPSLEEVEIVDCPLMKTFSLGSLSSPKLRGFLINEKEIGMKDLNDGINHFITKMENQDENKDDSDDDEKHGYSTEAPDFLRKFGKTAEKYDTPSMGDILWNLEYALRLQETVIPEDPEENNTNATGQLTPAVDEFSRVDSRANDTHFDNSNVDDLSDVSMSQLKWH